MRDPEGYVQKYPKGRDCSEYMADQPKGRHIRRTLDMEW
jgi:hypothetical protein